jgi:hypothetical protein
MFAVIYQIILKPGREKEYQNAWRKVARYFIEKRGAIGSALHRSENGVWIAYSRWPSKEKRDASWPGEKEASIELPQEIIDAIAVLKDCADNEQKIPEICMNVVESFL